VLIDLTQDASISELRADICIVGAGAAGITLARDLLRSGYGVCLLEAGGIDFDAQTQALYAGANVGMPYYDLDQARLRFFGGTTSIWGGRCAPLDEIDFKPRPWVAHSGWPITAEDLDGYVRRAHADLQLGEYRYDASLWRGAEPPFDSGAIRTRFWRIDELKERFLAPRCADLMDAPSCRILTHANVVAITLQGDHVDHLSVKTLTGRSLEVYAPRFVLACGGIENARLLLAADIGNRFDQVGRYFMEHPHGRVGDIESPNPYALWRAFRRINDGRVPVEPALTLAPEVQARTGALNSAVTLKLQHTSSLLQLDKKLYQNLKHALPPSKSGRALWRAYRRTKAAVQRSGGRHWKRLMTAAGTQRLSVIVRAEQAPNASSRVLLSTQKDALGVPRATLDWQLSAIDKETVRTIGEVLDAELRRKRIGRLEAAPWLADASPEWPVDPSVGKHPIGGYHHMGTTRMSPSPRSGVVDADCRVHGIDNLYVSGSSVFPTGGWANPTLTILALAHRLADHLAADRSNRPSKRSQTSRPLNPNGEKLEKGRIRLATESRGLASG